MKETDVRSSEFAITGKSLTIRYQNTYDDVMEGLRLLAGWAEGKAKTINLAVMTVIAAVYVVLFALCPANVSYLLIVLLLIAAMLTVFYIPQMRRKKLARRTQEINGLYKVSLDDAGNLAAKAEGTISIRRDEHAKVIESDHLYVLRLKNAYTFIIPKRALKADEDAFVRTVLQEHAKRYSQRKLPNAGLLGLKAK